MRLIEMAAMHRVRQTFLPGFTLLAVLALGAANCKINASDKDAGPNIVDNTCQKDSDCSSSQSCVVGLCLSRCSLDDVCETNQYCSTMSGFCELGCRSKEQCPEGLLCSRGGCVQGGGPCATKQDCESGLVCKDDQCVAPPATCIGPNDCPDDQLCNGFTQTCFDPNPTGCNNTQDCVGRQGCESGCTCNPSHECVVGWPCTLDNEREQCGIGGICFSNACVPTPSCTAQTDCDSYGLYCNMAAHICQRTGQCSTEADCVSQAPATHCNVTDQRCEVPTCMNGGLTCTAPMECNQDTGRCAQPAGATCYSNLDCCPDDNDNNQTCQTGVVEFCDVPTSSVEGSCRTGCRTNADCTGTDMCNALHQCEPDGNSNGGAGDPCESIEDCRAGYWCGNLTNVCYERCNTDGATCPDECPETCLSCQTVMFVSLCME